LVAGSQVVLDPVDTRSLGGTGKAVGQPAVTGGPAMEKRNIFSLFRIWIRRQGGQVGPSVGSPPSRSDAPRTSWCTLPFPVTTVGLYRILMASFIMSPPV